METKLLFVNLMSLMTLSYVELKCGIYKHDLKTRMNLVDGEIVQNHAYPWMAFLMLTYFEPDGKLTGFTCSASLIKKQWILTSAYCLIIAKSVKFADGVVILGTNDISAKHKSKRSIKITIDQKNVSFV